MKIVNVNFEQPNADDSNFVAETDDYLPHGEKDFGGTLLHRAEGWKARAHVAVKFGEYAKTREQAVENCLADAVKVYELEVICLSREIQEAQRSQFDANLQDWLHEMRERVTPEQALFRTLREGLNENEMWSFVSVMVESCKREDGRFKHL